MIGKGKAISHTKVSIQYGWNQKKDAEVVFKQLLAGDTPEEISQEFKIIQSMNEKCKRNTFSFILSPTIEDGKKLTSKDLSFITSNFIKELKLENHQAIAFVHNDKAHIHVHLYVNRINFSGKAFNDSFIGKRSQKTAEKVAKKMGLQTVKEVIELKLENLKGIRKYIKKQHDLCMKIHKPKSYDEYINAMKKMDMNVKAVIGKNERLQGFRFLFREHNLKGSEVHKQMSKSNIEKQLVQIRNEQQMSQGLSM